MKSAKANPDTRLRLELDSLASTRTAGKALGRHLPPPSICLFFGEMASGKTTLIKSVCEGVGIDPKIVISPTYTLVNVYPGSPQVYHVDFFRLEAPEELLELDRDDWINPEGPTFIEWPEPARPLVAGEAVLEAHLRASPGKPDWRELVLVGGRAFAGVFEAMKAFRSDG